jgi:fatty acid desaturase
VARRINWYQTPIDRALLRELTTKRDIRALVHVLAHLGLAALTGAGVYFAHRYLPWPFLIPALFIHGTVYTFFGPNAAGHELSHRTAFRTRWLNELFMALTSFLSWFPYVWFRKSHAQHHQLTVHHDLDLEVVLPQIHKPSNWIWMFTVNVQHMKWIFPFVVRHALGIFPGEWEKRILPESDERGRRKAIWWARLVLLGHIALGTVFVLTGNWIFLLIVTFGTFFANWLAYMCAFPQHAGLMPDVPDFRVCCRTMILGPVSRFLYWNMNYHVEHHMYAGVPFYNLPRLRRAVEFDVPVATRGIFRNWRELAQVFRRQREDPNYVAVPEMPETAAPARMSEV